MTFYYHRRQRFLGICLVVLSLAFHLVTVALYQRQPDLFAAFTIFPIWIWGILGFGLAACAYLAFRAPLSLLTAGAWALTVFLFADETLPLGRLGSERPRPGIPERHLGQEVVRVATINWAGSPGNFSPAILKYQPDIVCIQEIPHPYRLRQLSQQLYGGKGDYRYDARKRCGIVVRGNILRHIRQERFRNQQVTARLPDGNIVEIANLHLTASATDMRFWESACWRRHRSNRQVRRSELATALYMLKASIPKDGRGLIVAGDFNAPANDNIYRLLERDMVNTFDAVGTGWPNTYHRRIPLMRLDHIYVNRRLRPVRSRAVSIPESDHRMVVSDLVFQ